MAKKPSVATLTNSSVAVLNAIRNNASTNYQNYVPIATSDADSVRSIGAIIMDYPTLQNEFVSALINRIALTLVSSKLYQNPWRALKKGYFELGESIEDIFVEMATPYQYDAELGESETFKRHLPNVHSAFYVMNYQKYYPVTIQDKDLRKAFLSWNGVVDLIGRIVEQLYTGANYDEFLTMKYLIALQAINGRINAEYVATSTEDEIKATVATVRDISTDMTFMKTKYNIAGVKTFTNLEDQYVILTTNFNARMDVNVLASAFGVPYTDFLQKRILIDGFGELDMDRLNILFADDENFYKFSQDELALLNKIDCLVIDKDFLQIYDNLNQFTENFSGVGLYWNYNYHQWKTFAVSPFANAALFAESESNVTSITITPSAASASVGQTVQLSATVETQGFASQAVNWSVGDSEHASITASGLLTVLDGASGTINVTATSVYDSNVTGTATVTIS